MVKPSKSVLPWLSTNVVCSTLSVKRLGCPRCQALLHSFDTAETNLTWHWCDQCGFSGDLLRVYAKHTRQSRQISARELAAKNGATLGKQEQELVQPSLTFQRRVYHQRISRVDVLSDLASRWGWCRFSQFFTAIDRDGLLAAGYARKLPFEIKTYAPLLPIKQAPGLISGYLLGQEKTKTTVARLHPLLAHNSGGLVLSDTDWLGANLVVIGDPLKSARCQSLLDNKVKARTSFSFAGLYEAFPGAAATAIRNVGGQVVVAAAEVNYELLATAIKLNLPVAFDIDCEDWLLKNKTAILLSRLQKAATSWENWLSRYTKEVTVRELVLLVKSLNELGLPLSAWLKQLGSAAANRITQNIETAALCPVRNFRRLQIAKAVDGYWLVDRDGNLSEKLTDFTFDVVSMEIGATYKTNSYDIRLTHEKQSFNVKADHEVEKRPFDVLRNTTARLTGKLLTCDRRWRQHLFDMSLLFDRPTITQNQTLLGYNSQSRVCRFGAFGISAFGEHVPVDESPTVFDALQQQSTSITLTTSEDRRRVLLATLPLLVSLMLSRLQLPSIPFLLTGKAARLYAGDFYRQLLLNDKPEPVPGRFPFFVQDSAQQTKVRVEPGAYVIDAFRKQLATFLCEHALWIDAATFPITNTQTITSARWLLVDAYQRSCQDISHFETCRSVTDILSVYESRMFAWYGHSYGRKTLRHVIRKLREPTFDAVAAGLLAYVLLYGLFEESEDSLLVSKLKLREHMKTKSKRQLPLSRISDALTQAKFLIKETPGYWHIRQPRPGVVRICNRYRLS